MNSPTKPEAPASVALERMVSLRREWKRRETAARKKDLLGYCGTHGENRRQVFPELEAMKAPAPRPKCEPPVVGSATGCAYVALCRHGSTDCAICLREMLDKSQAELQSERQHNQQLRATLRDRERKLASRHNAPDQERLKGKHE